MNGLAGNRHTTNGNFVMTEEKHFSDAELARISEIREQIKRALADVFIKPERALAKFDNDKRTLPAKEQALVDILKYTRRKKREQIIEGLAGQPWDIEEIDRYLAKFDLSGGLNSASGDQIERIWSNMKDGSMIGDFKSK